MCDVLLKKFQISPSSACHFLQVLSDNDDCHLSRPLSTIQALYLPSHSLNLSGALLQNAVNRASQEIAGLLAICERRVECRVNL